MQTKSGGNFKRKFEIVQRNEIRVNYRPVREVKEGFGITQSNSTAQRFNWEFLSLKIKKIPLISFFPEKYS